MQNIFISYRRDDAIDVTGRIADVLKGKLGEDILFKDVDSIPLGTDFRRVIAAAVGRCDVLLAVIGDDWLEAKRKGEMSTMQAPSRRIDDPNDYVHIEIRAALERDIPVIPVLVERANMPQDKDLPEPLRPLAFRNAISVRPDPDFHNDMQRLCHALSGVVSPNPKPPKPRSRTAVVLASLIVMLALGAAVYFLTPLKHLQAFAPKEEAARQEAERLTREKAAAAEEQAAKARSEEAARQEAERLSREKAAAAEEQAAKARSDGAARREAERLSREKAKAEEQAAKAQSEEVARQEAERFAAAKAELLASQERLLQIAIANASWEAADELSTKLLQGGLPADRLRGYLQAIAKGRMEAELAASKASNPSDLPASGFFDLDDVFANGPYADYHRVSKTNIFKTAQNRLKARNFYQMEADGTPGAESQKALIAFQREKVIKISGRLDRATLEALGLLGLNDVEPSQVAPQKRSEVAPAKPAKSRTRSSQTSSLAKAKASPTPSRRATEAKTASQETKQASQSSRSSPPSPVDAILGQ
jgi:peptidoglycan hydrolase-like protein with peptidoglycan-binding domain